MKIAIIGKGNMGAPLGELAKKAGHDVSFATRSPEEPLARALEGAEMVILALPYAGAISLAEDAGFREALGDRVVVDLTNPLAPDYMSLTVGHTTSAGEEIARRLPAVRLVKAFNTTFSEVLRQRVAGAKAAATVFVAGDDEEAKRRVRQLAEAFGFQSVDAGALASARYLEPVTELLIQLAYGKGMGTKIALSLVSA